jgi:zinc resistance-associated protein
MRNLTVAATLALAMAVPTVALAQQQPAPAPAEQQRFERWRPSAEDIAALTDARLAGLKAGLRLTPAQEQHWPAIERAIRDSAKERLDRFNARNAAPPAIDPIERLRQRADAMTTRANSLKRLADAAAPLYQSLDEAQKRRFAMLARMAGPRHRGPRFWRRDRGGLPPR